MGEIEKAFIEQIRKAGELLSKKSNLSTQTIGFSPVMFRDDWKGKVSPLLYLLLVTADRRCYHPRDKVYALYGMVPVAQEVYPPDYMKDPALVLKETVAFIINHEQGEVIYKVIPLRDDRLDKMSYPSWMPELGQVGHKRGHIHPGISTVFGSSYQDKTGIEIPKRLQSQRETPYALVSEDLTTLSLAARNLSVFRVAFRLGDRVSTISRQVRGLLQTDPASVPEGSLGRTIRDQKTLIARMARACVAHESYNSDLTTDRIIQDFNCLFESTHQRGQALPQTDDASRICKHPAEGLF